MGGALISKETKQDLLDMINALCLLDLDLIGAHLHGLIEGVDQTLFRSNLIEV